MIEVLEKHYRENFDLLVKRISNRLKCQEDAEDVVQEAYSRALNYLESCNKDFDRWFSVILVNAQRDFMNKKKAQGIVREVEDSDDADFPNITELNYLAAKELERLAADKSELMKEIVRLHVNFGYTARDISFILDCNHPTVKVYLSNFHKQIKEMYV